MGLGHAASQNCCLVCVFFLSCSGPTDITTLPGPTPLPFSRDRQKRVLAGPRHSHQGHVAARVTEVPGIDRHRRSEEHTSELQSQSNLVCRLLLEKKK